MNINLNPNQKLTNTKTKENSNHIQLHSQQNNLISNYIHNQHKFTPSFHIFKNISNNENKQNTEKSKDYINTITHKQSFSLNNTSRHGFNSGKIENDIVKTNKDSNTNINSNSISKVFKKSKILNQTGFNLKNTKINIVIPFNKHKKISSNYENHINPLSNQNYHTIKISTNGNSNINSNTNIKQVNSLNKEIVYSNKENLVTLENKKDHKRSISVLEELKINSNIQNKLPTQAYSKKRLDTIESKINSYRLPSESNKKVLYSNHIPNASSYINNLEHINSKKISFNNSNSNLVQTSINNSYIETDKVLYPNINQKSKKEKQVKENTSPGSQFKDYEASNIKKKSITNININNNINNTNNNINIIINSTIKVDKSGNIIKSNINHNKLSLTQGKISNILNDINNNLKLRKISDEIKEKKDNTNKEPVLLYNNNHISNISNEEDNINNITYSNLTDAAYFLKESSKLSNFIMEYYNKNRDYPKTDLEFYKIGRFLGKGAFGKVNLSLHILTGRLVAMKSFNKNKISDLEKLKRKITHETNILKSLHHKNVVKMYETFETSKFYMITMEYISCGDLLSYVRKRTKLNEVIAKFIYKQVINGIRYIHSKNVIHRDIKLDNILIDINSNIKICDFGVAKKIKKNDFLNDQCGTPAYIAPEIFRGEGYEGPPVDVWSSGVVLYTMLSGSVPFKAAKIKDLQKIINRGVYNKIKGISIEAENLLSRLLEIDVYKRITTDEILNHPWLMFDENELKESIQLFTDSEKIHLSNENIDYRQADHKDLIEAFTYKNLDTIVNNENNKSKSNILAPFNSSQEETIVKSGNSLVRLEVLNNIIKFDQKVKALNKQYELNNNGEIDNGIVISPKILSNDNSNESFEDKKKGVHSKINSRFGSNLVSPNVEREALSHRGSYMNGVSSSYLNKIDDDIVYKLSKLGYNSEYIRKQIINNEINYCTASYYLLVKNKDL